MKSKIKVITTKWLIKENGCEDGIKWFKRNYPDGMKITKRNIRSLMEKLLKRMKPFMYQESIKMDTFYNMNWVLERIYGKRLNRRNPYLIGRNNMVITANALTNSFWKIYRDIK